MKDLMINAIHHLIYNNIYCSDPNNPKWARIAANGYEKRIIGFRSELELKRKFWDKKLFDGGWMLSIQPKNRCYDNAIYFTISKESPDRYTAIYNLMVKLKFLKLLFIQYDSEGFFTKQNSHDILGIGVDIPYPDFTFYEFQDGKFKNVNGGSFNLGPLTSMFRVKTQRYEASYKLNQEPPLFANNILSGYPEEELLGILTNRFIFDGVLGFRHYRGIPSDIDLIVETDSGFEFIEVKEKDRAKRIEGFGMDTARMYDILFLSDTLQVPYFYYVMEVNSQVDRKFKGWWEIEIHDFQKYTAGQREIEGGTGIATATENNHPTLVAPIKHFNHKFKDSFSIPRL